MNRRLRLAAVVVIASLGLAAAPSAQASPRASSKGRVFCAYADNPWAPAATCIDNPLPNRLPLPW